MNTILLLFTRHLFSNWRDHTKLAIEFCTGCSYRKSASYTQWVLCNVPSTYPKRTSKHLLASMIQIFAPTISQSSPGLESGCFTQSRAQVKSFQSQDVQQVVPSILGCAKDRHKSDACSMTTVMSSYSAVGIYSVSLWVIAILEVVESSPRQHLYLKLLQLASCDSRASRKHGKSPRNQSHHFHHDLH